MKQEKVRKAILITGTVILIAVFANVVSTISISVNSFNASSSVVSAFAG